MQIKYLEAVSATITGIHELSMGLSTENLSHLQYYGKSLQSLSQQAPPISRLKLFNTPKYTVARALNVDYSLLPLTLCLLNFFLARI